MDKWEVSRTWWKWQKAGGREYPYSLYNPSLYHQKDHPATFSCCDIFLLVPDNKKTWFLTGGIPAALAAKADVLCEQPKLRPPLQYMGIRRLNIMCLAGFKVNVLLTDANTSIHDKYTKEKSNVIIIIYWMSNNKIIHETYSFIQYQWRPLKHHFWKQNKTTTLKKIAQ